MSKCSNCGAVLSCGCQKRVASNGVSVCTGCLASYEIQIKSKNATTNPNNHTTANTNFPTVTGISVHLGTF